MLLRRFSIAAGPQTLALLAAAAWLGAMGYAMSHSSYSVWGAFIVGPILLAVSVPMLRAATRREPDHRMRRIIYWAFALKLLSAVPRYAVAFLLYGGGTDAVRYDQYGRIFMPVLRSGNIPDYGNELIGTSFMELLTGGLYVITGPTRLGAYLVFTWAGFWGMYLCYRAFVRAVPQGNHRTYALLILFWPSMLFWPSGIGKEAVMTFCIGLAAYGAARIYTRARWGFVCLGIGLALSALVRPHITLILFAAIAAGYLLRPAGPRATALAPIAKVAGVLVLGVASIVVLKQAASFLDVENVGVSSVGTVVSDAVERTNEGGSTFRAEPVHSPADLPRAFATVLIRPFPWEAHNAQALLSAAEGVFLLYLFWRNRARLRRLPIHLKSSYPTFCVLYMGMFVYAFSTFGNFGILARERVQVLPFVLALVCLPLRPDRQLSSTAPVTSRRPSGRIHAVPPFPRSSAVDRVFPDGLPLVKPHVPDIPGVSRRITRILESGHPHERPDGPRARGDAGRALQVRPRRRRVDAAPPGLMLTCRRSVRAAASSCPASPSRPVRTRCSGPGAQPMFADVEPETPHPRPGACRPLLADGAVAIYRHPHLRRPLRRRGASAAGGRRRGPARLRRRARAGQPPTRAGRSADSAPPRCSA